MRYLSSLAVGFKLVVGFQVSVAALLFNCGASALHYGLFAFGAGLVGLVDRFVPEPGRLRRLVFCAVVRSRRRFRRGVAAAGAAVPSVVGRQAAPRVAAAALGAGLVVLLGTAELLATGPWEKAAENLCKAFTGPIGKGLSLVAIALGGLMFAFGEGGSKSALAGLVFGAGMVLAAPQFLAWLGIAGIAC